jgi:hypothetical protein
MPSSTNLTDTTLTLRLSENARLKLAQRAAQSGLDIAAVASDLIEHAIVNPSVDELLAPFRKQVEESGMSDTELDDFLQHELEEHRRERKAKSA